MKYFIGAGAVIAALAAVVWLMGAPAPVSNGPQERGTFAVSRAWTDEHGAFQVVGTYRNDTQATFSAVVVVKCDALDASGDPIETDDTPIFAMDRGPIGPGFESTVKVTMPDTKAANARCEVTEAR